mgnify:CR=1 FL=1
MVMDANTRINIAVNLDPEKAAAGTLGGEFVVGGTNVMYSKYTDGRTYAETRPAIYIASRKPEATADGKGRGLFYWESAGKLITVYDDTLREGIYGLTIGTIDAGRDPVYWAEFSSTQLLMTDPENNKVWLITNTAGALSLTDHSGVVQGDLINEGIAGGIVVLDNYAFIMSKAGKIYNSEVGDINTDWNALNFLTTERAVDPGVFLCKQSEHIVAISSSSLEVFYDAARPVGSPLARRADISYLIGANSYRHCYTNGTKLFFIGATHLGSFSVFKLEGLKITTVSHQSIDGWMNNTMVTYGGDYMVTCATLGEHFLVYVTSVFSAENDTIWAPVNTAVFDDSTQLWSRYQTYVLEGTEYDNSFPVYAISERSSDSTLAQSFMLSDGSICYFSVHGLGRDAEISDPYVTEDGTGDGAAEYWDLGYTTIASGDTYWPIDPKIVTEEWDGGIYTNKFMHRLVVVGRERGREQDDNAVLEMQYSDDVYNSWSNLRTLKAKTHWMYTRMGKFKRRSIKIQYRGNDYVRIEAIEVAVGASQYA